VVIKRPRGTDTVLLRRLAACELFARAVLGFSKGVPETSSTGSAKRIGAELVRRTPIVRKRFPFTGSNRIFENVLRSRNVLGQTDPRNFSRLIGRKNRRRFSFVFFFEDADLATRAGESPAIFARISVNTGPDCLGARIPRSWSRIRLRCFHGRKLCDLPVESV